MNTYTRKLVYGLTVVAFMLIAGDASAQKNGIAPTAEKRCLTVMDPCDPASCNYDPGECEELNVSQEEQKSTISLSNDTEKQVIYITENDLTVTSTLPVSLGEKNTLTVPFQDKATKILSPLETHVRAQEVVPTSYSHLETFLRATEKSLIYASTFQREVQLWGIINLKPQYTITLDAQTGEILTSSSSWYSFLFR